MTTHDSHPMTGGHPLPPDHPEQTKVIFLWGVVTVVILVVLVVWARSYFFLVRNEFVQRNYLSAPNPKIDEQHAREQQVLSSYGWVDRQKGIVHIPIDQAMDIMVRDAQSGSSPSSGARP